MKNEKRAIKNTMNGSIAVGKQRVGILEYRRERQKAWKREGKKLSQ